ncbi:MAG: hypothetical protein FJY73_06135 [Candidatus Eisenbacteria bacterium]|nr:hypothetical protein [Candidatus Eisenbacteria bacterium]
MNPREVHEAYAEVEELLAIGQPPAIALLLRARFLAAVFPLGATTWSAYGFRAAQGLASALASSPAHLFSGDSLDEIRRVLEEIRKRPVPSHAAEARWRRDLEEAAQAFEAAERDASQSRKGTGTVPAFSARGGFEERVLVPVVASVRGAEALSPLFRGIACGLLVPITVRVEGMLRTTPGSAPVILRGVPGQRERELREVFAQIPSLGIRSVPPLRRCLFRVDWDEAAASLEGRSAELGLFLAGASAYSALGVGSLRGRVRPRTAFTGVVEGDRVGPVDEGTLAAKVSACFHGPVDALFVPAEQLGEAERTARVIEERHPNRHLRVRGVSTLSGLWRDPDAVEAAPRNVRERAAAAAKRFPMSPLLVGIAALAVPLLGFLIVQQFVFERNLPVTARWEGNRIVATNTHGRDTAVLEGRLMRPEMVESCTFDKIGTRLAVLDLDGDGKNEVVAMYRGNPTKTDLLAAFDRNGTRRWEHSAASFGFPPTAPCEELQWLAFYSGERQGGSLTLLTLRKVPLRALSFVDRIDGATGEHLGMLRNEGHIEGVYPAAVDRDPAAFLCGTDNETGMGLLSLIRSSRLSLPEGPRFAGEIPSLTDPESRDQGVVVSIRFPLDAFSHTRAHVLKVVEDRPGVFRIFVEGGGEAGEVTLRSILYACDFSEPSRPSLESVQFTDSFRRLIFKSHPDAVEADLDVESERLACETRFLTAEGWRPIDRRPSVSN